MRKIFFAILLIAILLIASRKNASAGFENIPRQNNKFGIHLAIPSEKDIKDAAGLVNSSGGDWGYVTVVMEENDRNLDKWQNAFDQMRQFHLIPIVRLATGLENDNWRSPKKEEAEDWANFLNSLNWVTKNRYIVLFNEPNSAKEWGGKVDPEDYAQVALSFSEKLKEKSSDFYVMLAGLDAAAPQSPPNYEDEGFFLKKVFASEPELAEKIDGWASHSYPNHGFIGSPYASGQHSVKGYIWELNLLKQLGLSKNLPVFVTETGWPHAEGLSYDKSFFPQNQINTNLSRYFNLITSDPKVVAVTPFILNYQGEPFDHFSWKKTGEGDFYPQYNLVQAMEKTKGQPEQEQKLKITSNLPDQLIVDSTYRIPVNVRNEGQAIWSKEDGYNLNLKGGEKLDYFFSDFSNLKPNQEETIWLYLKTNQDLKQYDLVFYLSQNNQEKGNAVPWSFQTTQAVKINFQVNLFPKRETNGNYFKIVIYNSEDEVVYEKTNVKIEKGLGVLDDVHNLALGQKYRVVILKPYYLPRQQFITANFNNQVNFTPMFPLDLNLDGKFSALDLWMGFFQPRLRNLYWPLN